MKQKVVMLSAGMLLAGGTTVHAIPPPWTLEEAKAAADLVLIAQVESVEQQHTNEYLNAAARLSVIKTLKGTLPSRAGAEETGGAAGLVVVYHSTPPAKQRVPDGAGGPGVAPVKVPPIRPMAIGGAGEPRIKAGDTALVFLKKRPGEQGDYAVAVGSFGYVALDTASPEDMAKLKERLSRYADWAKHEQVKDRQIGVTMQRYYAEAMAMAAELAKTAKFGRLQEKE